MNGCHATHVYIKFSVEFIYTGARGGQLGGADGHGAEVTVAPRLGEPSGYRYYHVVLHYTVLCTVLYNLTVCEEI